MRVLLPPSETKVPGGGSAFREDRLFSADRLGATREEVRLALEALCADEEAAAKALKLGARSRSEIALNRGLSTAPALPAIERYTGVLYDALNVASLDSRARAWADRTVLIQSALFGLVRAGDPIPQYRLSASSRLPGAPLKRAWRDAHAGLDWRAFGWILDLRSKDYAELAPVPAGLGHALAVGQRDGAGIVRALNHFNKAAKGDLVARLARTRPELTGPEEFVAWANTEGLEARIENGALTLVVAPGAKGSVAPGGDG